MATFNIQADSPMAKAIQEAIQPQIVANGWTSDETDKTLAEYITTLLVNGADQTALVRELGADLLGAEPGDERPAEFGNFLFNEVRKLVAAEAQGQAQDTPQAPVAPAASNDQDVQMSGDGASSAVDNAPTGPRSMRANGPARGRGGRMMGQVSRAMDRSNDNPDPLRRIRGAAGGQSGRINSHARDGAQRGARGGGANLRGAHGRGNGFGGIPAMNNMMGNQDPAKQMQMMQFIEMQMQTFHQMMNNGGPMPGMNGNGYHANGGHRGGRGGAAPRHNQIHAVNGKLPDGPLTPSGGNAMDVDGGERKDRFDVLCRFNLGCTNPTCGFAHQSPAAPANTTVDLTDTCPFGSACANTKCSARHPSPAQNTQGAKQQVDCKFYPNCTNVHCPFRHPSDVPVCRNGADCNVPDCKFLHSKIPCRYNPCLNPSCTFKHNEGQRGKYGDKVWVAGQGTGGDEQQKANKSERFGAFAKQAEGQTEELIIPNAANADSADNTTSSAAAPEAMADVVE